MFYENSAAQCVRCHAIFEYGGNVGPGLEGVADRLIKQELLQALIRPRVRLAPGYETVLVTYRDSSAVAGVGLERSPEALKLKAGEEDILTIARADILEEESLPSSMPSMEGKLSRREVRDVVAFLAGLGSTETR